MEAVRIPMCYKMLPFAINICESPPDINDSIPTKNHKTQGSRNVMFRKSDIGIQRLVMIYFKMVCLPTLIF